MLDLLKTIVRWAARNLLSFALILAILVAASFVVKEHEEYKSISAALAEFRTGKTGLEQHIGAKEAETIARTKSFDKASMEALDARIRQIDGEIAAKAAMGRSSPDAKLCVFVGGAACGRYFDAMKAAAELRLLERERDYLKALHSAAVDRIAKVSGIAELERLRLIHVTAYADFNPDCSSSLALKSAYAVT